MHFGLHSVRIGGATRLAGGATLQIQQVGRWTSDAYIGYNRQTEEGTVEVSPMFKPLCQRGKKGLNLQKGERTEATLRGYKSQVQQ